MNVDYAYCNSIPCIHRRGCKRWVGNYKDEAVEELVNSGRDTYVDDKKCITSKPLPYDMLDRFRLSDGSPLDDE